MKNEKSIELALIVIPEWSRPNEAVESGVVEIRLEFETFQNIPANANTFYLI